MTGEGTAILVTGGAGYIGAHTCLRLAEEGWTPVVFDNLVYGHRDAVQWGPLEEGDLLDEARLEAVVDRWRPAAVVHFAAYAYVGESMVDPGKYYRNNVGGSLALLRVLARRGCPPIVFSSTCATYGEPRWVPITEDHPLAPINPYGRSKLMVEQILGDFEAAHGLRFAALRYFNAAGADPNARIGEHHEPETHLIPLVLDTALGRRPHVDVFGDDYPTPDGTCIRDYIHVADLADAHALALRHLLNGGASLTLNLGNGQGYSVLEVIRAAERATGRTIARRIAPRRPGDPPRLVGSSERAQRDLGWTPRYGELGVILEHAWAWHRRRFG